MRKVSMFILLVVTALFLAGCGSPTPPDEVVNEYWGLFQDRDTEGALELVIDGREDEVGDLDMEMEEVDEIEEVLFERFTVEAEGYEEDGEVAIVDVTVTKPDLHETFATFFEEGFEELMALAMEGASDEEMDEKAEEFLLEAMEDAEDISHDQQVELHLEDGEWKIYDWLFDDIEERMDELDFEDESVEQNGMDEESDEAAGDIDEGEAEVGDTVTTEAGDMTLIAQNDDIDAIETGPFRIDIEQVNAVSGDLNPQSAEMFDTEQLEYIQLDLQVENTSDEDLIFYAGQAQIVTNTGEQLESDMWMSDHIEGEFMGGVTQEGTLIYPLEQSQAEEVETVRIVIGAPQDEDWQEVGEEVDFEVEL
ncbi:hypothetical protein [Natranaerobius thermophilus]|uniref:DUF4352 domain-containing protein n=1 Tax=Natranaerobius thermophilus (strain ATCC BAA-1301 / DSM 18059 / JW/NM-WN-LF) TaxID=457570 RepID=B2A5D2_NATTJ|nr:hypothetical protein [Natranaerobius thermophilus]ACB83966.1 hypothetical protein Nther_0370 [Natranaerobius thermophilus JW/NM-WN-LF]